MVSRVQSQESGLVLVKEIWHPRLRAKTSASESLPLGTVRNRPKIDIRNQSLDAFAFSQGTAVAPR